MKLSDLLSPGEYTAEREVQDIEISAIVSDTRMLTCGALFVCLRGGKLDAHTLAARAELAGAAAIVAEQDAPLPEGIAIPVLRVKSTRRALADLHSRFHGCPEREMTLIGVTGTNGKTSTATVLYSILRAAGLHTALIGTAECLYDDKVYTLPTSDNGSGRLLTMTTPDPDILYPMLRMMRSAGITHAVMEVSSHALFLEKVAPISYAVGIFTNLSPEHLDFHNDMESYLGAKARLFSQCRIGIFNCDDPYAEKIIEKASCEAVRAGVVWQGDYRATDIELCGTKGTHYTLQAPGLRMRIRTPLPGSFSVYNTLLALTAALRLGIAPNTAANALAAPIHVPGRLERVALGAGCSFSVFIDYAHTEHALRSLLLTVRAFRKSGERIVLLFGCGGERDKTKRAPMGKTAEELADCVILTSDNPRTEDPKAILDDILSGMQHPTKHRVILSRRRAIEAAITEAMPGDIILLVGKGHEHYEITASGVHPFDERKIVLSALEKIKKGDTD